MPFFVYILQCSDTSYYTGHTDNLDKRLAEHTQGTLPSCYTFKRRPVQLVFQQSFGSREEALAAERQIKGWSRAKKEAMMRGDWQEVSRLARTGSRPSKSVLRQAQDERESSYMEKIGESRDEDTTGIITLNRREFPVRPEPVEGRTRE